MSVLVSLEPAVNRLLPYRGMHTDLVAAEEYYTFNDPAVPALLSWTLGSNAELLYSGTSSSEYFDGDNAFEFYPSVTATNDVNVYAQAVVSNLDSGLPCTVRVIVKSDDANRWLRIYDPGDAGTDVWVDVFNGALGTVGADIIEALLSDPPPGTTNEGGGITPGEAPGQANNFVQVELELPAAASRTIRLQLVDGNGETNFTGSTADNQFWLARADVRNGKVERWRCRQTGRTFSQATASLQPYARPMGVPQFNGRRVLNFAGGRYLVSDDTASEWGFLASGVECSIYAAALLTADSSGYVLSTVLTTDGFRWFYDPTPDDFMIAVYNTAAALVFDTAVPAVTNALYILGYRALDGHADGDAVFDLGGTEYVQNASNWGNATPTNTLYIGARPPGAITWDGYIADIAIYNVRLDDDEHARAIEEFEAWNAASASIPGCVLAVRADVGVQGDPITQWLDQSPEGNDLTGDDEGTPFEQPAPEVALRGSKSIRLDGEQYFFSSAFSADLPNLNADHAVIVCAQLLDDSTGDDILWEIRDLSVTNTYETLGYTAGQWVYTRRAQGGSTDTASTGTGDFLPHVHSFVHASGQRSAWVDGSALFSGVASNPGTMTGVDTVLLGKALRIDAGAHMQVAEFAVYNVAPNTYQRQLVERAQRRRMLGGKPLIQGHSLGAVSRSDTSLLGRVTQANGFLWDFRTADGYTLGAGTNIDEIIELTTDTPTADNSAPAQLSAAGLDGADCLVFNGTTHFYPVTLAALIAAGQSDGPYTLIARCGFDILNNAKLIAGFYDSTGAAYSAGGQSSTGTMRYRTVTTAGATANSNSTNGLPDTSGHTYRYEVADAGATLAVSFFVDGVADPANPVTIAKSGSSAFNRFGVGGPGIQLLDGRLAVLAVVPGAPNSSVNEGIEAAI